MTVSVCVYAYVLAVARVFIESNALFSSNWLARARINLSALCDNTQSPSGVRSNLPDAQLSGPNAD